MVDAWQRRWRVGELAFVTGVTVRALHHYDRLGLLVPAHRTAAGHRLYAAEDVHRLYRIVALRQLGLSLDEIASVLDRGHPGLLETVRRHLERVERDLQHQEILRGRLIAILERLDHSLEPSADQFLDALEAMIVITDVAEIARILGISRQVAAELAESAPDFPPPETEHAGRPVWVRREVEIWAAIHPDRGPAWRRPTTSPTEGPFLDLARAAARELEHCWIGDEHLLLGLLDPESPGAGRAALESLGLTQEAVRRAIVASVGDSAPKVRNTGLSCSHGVLYVLERANLKAIELRDEQVSSEHVLLALLDAPADSRALTVLAGEGVYPAALAERVITLTDRGPRSAGAARALPEDVHAAEVARILGVSRGRVVELAASAAGLPPSRFAPVGYRVWPRAAVETWAASHPNRGPEPSRLIPPVAGGVGSGTERLLEFAKAEANELNHTWVGKDHLFLALFHSDCPGEAGAVLRSLGLALEEVRSRFVESMGDPYEPHDRELTIPPATQHALERATLAALELEDEEVTGAHMLLTLTRVWADRAMPLCAVLPELEAVTLHERLMAQTDGMMPAEQPPSRKPSRWVSTKRMARPPEVELALSPAGHDPRRRRPWGSRFFGVPVKQIPGKLWSPHDVQYPIDRDGYAVLTMDGRPVGPLQDDQGKIVLDEQGNAILTAVDAPEGWKPPDPA